MVRSFQAGLTLAVLIIVVGAFLPEIGAQLVQIVTIILDIILQGLAQVTASIP